MYPGLRSSLGVVTTFFSCLFSTLNLESSSIFFFFNFWDIHCCCLVAKSCPTLCDPMDCRGAPFSRVLCPWNSLGENTGVGCHCLLQGLFPTQGSDPGLLHHRRALYCWATREAQRIHTLWWYRFPVTVHLILDLSIIMSTSGFYSFSQSAAWVPHFLKVPQLEAHTAIYPHVHWLCLPSQV